MSLQLNDRVKETSTTTGTVPIVLSGASVGYQSIASSITTSNTFPYVIELTGGAQWEIGIGTYVSGNNSLIRQQVLSSSESGNLVDFLAGSKNVFITVPSAYTALTARGLSQFSATTSAELASIISDETGSGKLVFSNNAILVAPDIGRANGTSLTLSGDLSVTGNVYLSGNVTTLSSNNLSITDPLIYLAENNPANLQDIGFVGNFTTDNYQHTGLVRDATDGVWKLFSNVAAEPTTTIDFTEAVYDTIQVGSINTSNAIFSVANGSTPFTVVSNTLVSNLNADLLDGQHGAYYTGLSSSAFTQANTAYTQANTGVTIGQGAFAQANAAFDQANTGVTIGQGAFDQANTAYTQANTGVTIGQGAFGQANTGVTIGQGAFGQANTGVTIGQGAFGQANSGFNQANAAYTQANTGISIGQGAFAQANAAFDQANTGVAIGQGAFAQANSSFAQANAAYNQANTGISVGQGAFGQANAAYDQANTGVAIGQGAFGQANSAYDQANTGISVGKAAFGQANAAYEQANTGVAIGQGAFGQANSGFEQANSAYTQANTALIIGQNSFSQANAAYTQANTGISIGQGAFAQANSEPIGKNAFSQANSAYTQANTGVTIGQGAFDQANSSFAQANTALTVSQGAFSQANTGISIGQGAFDQANSAYTQANTGIFVGQGAFGQANTGVAIGQEAFGQANSAYTQANAAYGQANTGIMLTQTAFGQANLAYTQANVGVAIGQESFGQANSAYTQANTGVTIGQGAFDQANAAYNTSNTKFSANGGTINGTVTITNDLNVTGNVYLSGNVTTLSSNNISINDPLIYLAQDNPANIQDIGIVGNFTSSSYQHTGLVRDASDGIWKLFSNVATEPAVTIDFTGAVYDTFQVGTLVSSNASFTVASGTAPFTVNSVTLVNNLNADMLDGQQANYYTGLSNSANTQANLGVAIGQGAFVQANSGFNQANAAYSQANTAVTTGQNAFSQANAAYNQANTGITIGQGAFGQANVALTTGQTAFTQANTALTTGQTAFTQANSAFTQANVGILLAQTAFTQANTGITIGQGAFDQANSAYSQANVGIVLAQTAFNQANVGYSQANVGIVIGQSAFAQANAAYNKANTGGTGGGLTPTAIKTANGYIAIANDLVRCNTVAGAFSVSLPASPADGAIIGITDIGNTFGINNLTLLPNGNLLESYSTPYILDINGAYVSFVYNTATTNWKLLGTPVTIISAVANVSISQGGTGVTTLAANSVLLGNGTSAVQTVSPGTTGNVLTSNNGTWISAPAPISLPTQTSNGGKYLTTDGATASWVSLPLGSVYDLANVGISVAQGAFSQANAAYNTANTKFSANGGTITGSVTIATDLSVNGNVYLNGNVTTLSSNNLSINDPLIYLAQDNPANIQDIGIVGHFTSSSYQHTGLVRDATDGIWKLFSNVASEPTTTMDFTGAIYDTLKVGSITASNASFTIATGTAPFTVTSNTLVSNLNADLLDGQHGSYYANLANAAYTAANTVSTINLPTIRPSLLLDFANRKKLDPRITFTRANTATYFDSDGLLKTAAINSPRFDHNPTTGESLGLLIEEARTNLLTYSENFDNAAWVKNNVTVTANATTAPDGTVTADKLVENTASGAHYVMESITSSNGVYTCSVYAKAGERTIMFLGMSDGVTALSGAFFNLSTLAITPSTGGSWSATSNTIQDTGNGWYRCIVTGTRGAGTATTSQIYHALNTASVSYTGDGTSGIYIWGAQLEAGAFATSYIPSNDTFTSRASTGSFIGSNGLIQSAATNVARYNYNPLNLALSPKLLLEPAATNLLTYSENFANATWNVLANTSITLNSIAAPDGTLTADTLTTNAATIFGRSSISITTGGTYIISIFVKKGNTSFFRLRASSGANSYSQWFNLDTNSISTTSQGGTDIVFSSSAIIDVGGGWKRVSLACSTTNISVFDVTVSPSQIASIGSTSGDYVYIWGAQLEAGTSATSYIQTVASQVTRAADVSSSAQTTRAADNAVMTGTNFSSWYRQDEGTLLSYAAMNQSSVDRTLTSINDGTSDNRIIITTGANTAVYAPFVVCAGSVVAVLNQGVSYPPSSNKLLALSYKVNDFAASLTGHTSVVDSSGAVPVVSTMNIGSDASGTPRWNGTIAKLAYYPKRLTNAELQAITTA